MSAAKIRVAVMKISNFKVLFQTATRETKEALPRFPEVLGVTYLDLKAALCNVAILSPD